MPAYMLAAFMPQRANTSKRLFNPFSTPAGDSLEKKSEIEIE